MAAGLVNVSSPKPLAATRYMRRCHEQRAHAVASVEVVQRWPRNRGLVTPQLAALTWLKARQPVIGAREAVVALVDVAHSQAQFGVVATHTVFRARRHCAERVTRLGAQETA